MRVKRNFPCLKILIVLLFMLLFRLIYLPKVQPYNIRTSTVEVHTLFWVVDTMGESIPGVQISIQEGEGLPLMFS